ncbi:MAG TPA: hypothetical protein VJN96_24390 [Vicinamibacterales bacterium]|nr:hypothetical protein [Vicinamibacterales bacterium]
MNLKRTVATAVVGSLMAGFLPATAWAAENDKNDKVDLKSATAKVLATTNAVGQVTTPAPAPGKPQKSNRRNSSNGGGGGGGTTGTVMMIVGIAASLGATYFVVKQMNKTTEQLTATPHAVR